MFSEGTWLTKKEEEEASAAEFCLFCLELLWQRSKSGTKTFICLRKIPQLFSRDFFSHQYDLKSSWDYTLLKMGHCAKNQMYDIWIQKDPLAYLMGLWPNSTGFFYLFISSACGCISCNDLSEWKIHAVSETGTSADCKVAPHQLKQGILPTAELSEWFHDSQKTQEHNLHHLWWENA